MRTRRKFSADFAAKVKTGDAELLALAPRRHEPAVFSRFLAAGRKAVPRILRIYGAHLRGMQQDWEQEALLAVATAVRAWDPARGPFMPYAILLARQAVQRAKWEDVAQRSGCAPSALVKARDRASHTSAMPALSLEVMTESGLDPTGDDGRDVLRRMIVSQAVGAVVALAETPGERAAVQGILRDEVHTGGARDAKAPSAAHLKDARLRFYRKARLALPDMVSVG